MNSGSAVRYLPISKLVRDNAKNVVALLHRSMVVEITMTASTCVRKASSSVSLTIHLLSIFLNEVFVKCTSFPCNFGIKYYFGR